MWKKGYKSRFVPGGRIGRKDFLKNALFIVACFVAFCGLGFFSSVGAVSIVSILYGLFLVYTLLCLYAKRMHDFGFRLWWLWLVAVAIELVCRFLIMSSLSGQVSRGLLLALLLIPFFKRGQNRTNKFGKAV